MVRAVKTDEDLQQYRLSVIARLLALNLIRNVPSRQEQVELLDVAGFRPRDISELLGISDGAVRFLLHRIRQTPAKKRAKLAKPD